MVGPAHMHTTAGEDNVLCVGTHTHTHNPTDICTHIVLTLYTLRTLILHTLHMTVTLTINPAPSSTPTHANTCTHTHMYTHVTLVIVTLYIIHTLMLHTQTQSCTVLLTTLPPSPLLPAHCHSAFDCHSVTVSEWTCVSWRCGHVHLHSFRGSPF